MNPDVIMLSEANHRKTNTIQFHVYEVFRAVKIIETKYNGSGQRLGKGDKGELLLNG